MTCNEPQTRDFLASTVEERAPGISNHHRRRAVAQQIRLCQVQMEEDRIVVRVARWRPATKAFLVQPAHLEAIRWAAGRPIVVEWSDEEPDDEETKREWMGASGRPRPVDTLYEPRGPHSPPSSSAMPRLRLRELTYDEAGYQLWCFATDHGLPPEFSAGAFIRACQAKKLSPSKALELGKANIRSTER